MGIRVWCSPGKQTVKMRRKGGQGGKLKRAKSYHILTGAG